MVAAFTSTSKPYPPGLIDTPREELEGLRPSGLFGGWFLEMLLFSLLKSPMNAPIGMGNVGLPAGDFSL